MKRFGEAGSVQGSTISTTGAGRHAARVRRTTGKGIAGGYDRGSRIPMRPVWGAYWSASGDGGGAAARNRQAEEGGHDAVKTLGGEGGE